MPPSMMYTPAAPVYDSCIIPVNMCNSNSMMGGMNYGGFGMGGGGGGGMFGMGSYSAAASNNNFMYGGSQNHPVNG